MSKKTFAFAEMRAQFFSDSHTFRHYNGGAERQLLKSFASASDPNFTGVTYYVGDIIDFEYLESEMKNQGLKLEDYPANFMDVLALASPKGGEAKSYTPDMYWQDIETHLRFFDTMIYKASLGKESILMGGNHDPGFFLLDGQTIEGIKIKNEAIYKTDNGKSFIVEHGQNFDQWFSKSYSDFVSYHACRAIDAALKTDYLLARKYPALEDSYFLTNTLKGLAKQIGVITPFRRNAISKAFNAGADGVICGHIHKFDDRMIQVPGEQKGVELRYLNIGDGMTHGNSLAHMGGDDWVKMKKKQMPESAKAILGQVNPLKEFRPNTLNFLRVAWQAELEYLRMKARQKQAENSPLPAPEPIPA